jgi:hypothetical protein
MLECAAIALAVVAALNLCFLAGGLGCSGCGCWW